MEIIVRNLLFCSLVASSLAACGSGGSGASGTAVVPDATDTGNDTDNPSDPSPPASLLDILPPDEQAIYYSSFLDSVNALDAASDAGDVIAFVDLPSTGDATYSGYMQLIMGNAVVSANVIGDATLELDFTSSEVTGQAANFLGVAEDEYGSNQVASYQGVVTVSQGSIVSGASGSADIDFGIDGVLDNGLNSFAITGTLVGYLNGADAGGLRAIGSNSGVHGNMDTTIDGVDTVNDIGIATVFTLKN